jgi:hypothetical protein
VGRNNIKQEEEEEVEQPPAWRGRLRQAQRKRGTAATYFLELTVSNK